MDLLCSTYSNSDDDDQDGPEPKRPRLGNRTPAANHRPQLLPGNELREASIPGRYVSKRERVLMGSLPAAPEPNIKQDNRDSTIGTFSFLPISVL